MFTLNLLCTLSILLVLLTVASTLSGPLAYTNNTIVRSCSFISNDWDLTPDYGMPYYFMHGGRAQQISHCLWVGKVSMR